MKAGWITTPLSQLCDIKHGFAFKSEFFTGSGDHVLLTPGNFHESGGYRDRGDKQKYYSGEIPDGFVLSEGDLLVAMTEQAAGLLGSPILVPESGNFLHNQRLGLVTKKAGAAWTNEFFFHVFNSDAVRKAIHDSATGVKVRHTSPSKIGEVIVTIPASLAEQRRIVGILDEAFEGLATAKANAEQNLQNARALFESHLQAVFTQRGHGWVEKPLESLGEIRTGKRDANHQVENGPYPFYTCAFGQFKSPTFSFDGPSIILPGNGANVGKVFFHDGRFEAYQRTYVVNELTQSINPRFLYFCFSANWPGWIATKQFGSATNYIVVGDLKAFPVPTPPLPVQKKTVEQLESFTEETQRLESLYQRKLAALDELKKSLLHRAFSGKL